VIQVSGLVNIRNAFHRKVVVLAKARDREDEKAGSLDDHD